LIGDAYVELQDYNNAIKYFKLASSNNPNEYFTPKYILKLALVYEKIDDLNSAINSYDQIIDEFKDSPEFQISLKNKSRLEGLI
jgi:TolA-binding protein